MQLAQLNYRQTRGPASIGSGKDSGCGFRGPGETKVETDKREIKRKIQVIKKEIEKIKLTRFRHKENR